LRFACCDKLHAALKHIRRFETDIVAYQRFFQLVEQAFIDISAQTQYRGK
jgi:hypothetical protein